MFLEHFITLENVQKIPSCILLVVLYCCVFGFSLSLVRSFFDKNVCNSIAYVNATATFIRNIFIRFISLEQSNSRNKLLLLCAVCVCESVYTFHFIQSDFRIMFLTWNILIHASDSSFLMNLFKNGEIVELSPLARFILYL